MKRARWMTLIHTALKVNQPRFARLTALQWLAAYPGDLEVQRLYAQALLAEGLRQSAFDVAAALVQRDPEDVQAVQTWALAADQVRAPEADLAWAVLAALEGDVDPGHPAPRWSRTIFAARTALHEGALERADQQVHAALATDIPFPLTAITHLEVMLARLSDPHDPDHALRQLIAFYHEKYPETLAFLLLHADALMDAGQEEQAVALLHQAVAADITGRVARRLWGAQHPYRSLWPDAQDLTLAFDQAIPAPVAAALGWNRLPDGKVQNQAAATQSNAPKTSQRPQTARRPQAVRSQPTPRTAKPRPGGEWRSIQQELKRIALEIKQPDLAQADARFPVYVVLSTQTGLIRTFGRQTAMEIVTAMQALSGAISTRRDWDAITLLADDPDSVREYGLEPASPDDPWAIKLLLADLDAKLAERGLMIGAVLIVGGDEVVPFHRLPNPVDDRDAEIPSDNPYATRNENYFAPEWPVGRLPGTEPGLILSHLRDYAKYHHEMRAPLPWHRRLWVTLRTRLLERRNGRPGFGYTAAVWERTAVRVLRPIGDPKDLWTSPPVVSNGRPVTLPHFPMAYFNLHGEPDKPAWFGQADPFKEPQGVDYPTALKPEDLIPRSVPQVIFTEACYGAHVFGKDEHQSLALRFLGCGTQALVGCTVTAYGSQTPPLYAADLLGHTFWKHVADGAPVGVALQKARLHYAREMHRKQGYLDGEDQKTLISFVLYGDPLFQVRHQGRHAKAITRPMRRSLQVKTVCDRVDSHEPISPEALEQVRQIVARYLPGMEGAHLKLGREHAECHGKGHWCPTAQLGEKARPIVEANRRVVVLSKSVQRRDGVHHHYARLTLDEQGRVVKIAVSR